MGSVPSLTEMVLVLILDGFQNICIWVCGFVESFLVGIDGDVSRRMSCVSDAYIFQFIVWGWRRAARRS